MGVPMVGMVADIGAEILIWLSGCTQFLLWVHLCTLMTHKDNMKKQADFYKNTGRHVKYGTDSYSARAYRTIGAELDRQIGRGKRAVRNVMDL